MGSVQTSFRTFAVTMTAASFLLHLGWEYLQCHLFFVHGSVPPTHEAMLIATVGDVVLTWVGYFLAAFVSRDWKWGLGTWSCRAWLAVEGFSLVASIAIELRALTRGRWSYTEIAPLVPGTSISLLPVLQLLTLLPASFALGRWYARRKSPGVR